MTDQLSKNFRRSEFFCTGFLRKSGCGCDGWIAVDKQLVDILQHLRDESGERVNLNSAYRCPKRNKQVGGASSSMHMKGIAADIWVGSEGTGPSAVWTPGYVISWLRHHYPWASSGAYDTFVHLDTRMGDSAFWDKRTKGGAFPAYTPPIPTDGKHSIIEPSKSNHEERITVLEAKVGLLEDELL